MQVRSTTLQSSPLCSNPARAARHARFAAVHALLIALMMAPGCAIGGWLADGVGGGGQRVKVEADYLDLEGHSVAVLVSADQQTLFYSPQARGRVVREVSTGIAEHVPETTLTDPRQITEFQRANDYWTTMRASRLLEQLEVERLVLIDLVEYRTHEPGNRHVWRGQVTGNVAVHAADADDPDNPDYYRTVSVSYPQDNGIGVVNEDTDRETIELAMVKVFGRNVVRLFHHHEVRR